MKIEILQFVKGAAEARGITVIIDVFRAFSTACYASDAGAARLIATGSINEALLLKRQYKNAVLAGERNEKKIEGFDFGNSPTEILKCDLSGKTFVHTTTAGTQGLVSAENADIILAGSLVNAAAIVKYIRHANPENVSLVAMGYRAIIAAEEDLLCATIIRDALLGKEENYEEEISKLKTSAGKRFFDPANLDFSPPTDFFLCTMLNRFDFVLKGERRYDGSVDLQRIEM
jgi:2-phosphosulfolactate phosphatase